jgi:hypothetical protein
VLDHAGARLLEELVVRQRRHRRRRHVDLHGPQPDLLGRGAGRGEALCYVLRPCYGEPAAAKEKSGRLVKQHYVMC